MPIIIILTTATIIIIILTLLLLLLVTIRKPQKLHNKSNGTKEKVPRINKW